MALRSAIKRYLLSSNPRKTIVAGSRSFFLNGFSFHEVFTAFVRQLRQTSLTERASGVAFNIVMAIPPTLLFIITLIPYLPISDQFISQMFGLIKDVIPGEKNHRAI